MFKKTVTAIVLASIVSACASTGMNSAAPLVTYSEIREPCKVRSATKNAYFGDLHIHTGFSYDARPFGTKLTPADAYRFAKGEPLGVPPYDDMGNSTRTAVLKRPLDFAAVTDHSEFFGEMKLCTDPANHAYGTKACVMMREAVTGRGISPFIRAIVSEQPERAVEICGADNEACETAAVTLWQSTQSMAEEAYDKSSSCEFTAFVGYEYTGTPNGSNIHRNVIFRNAIVPDRAISYVEMPTDIDLWQELTAQCLEGTQGCDVIAIPHNSNLSAGSMFPSYISRFESSAEAREIAEMRNRMEPIMEVFQHKGNSECYNGFADILGEPDELCNVEQVRATGDYVDFRGNSYSVRICEEGERDGSGFNRRGCISKNDFYRSVLLTGLQDRAVIGVNSYRIGVIASTDTHIGLSGHTDERDWIGHLVDETELEARLTQLGSSPRSLDGNPGGLAGVWAVENSRDAIFDSFKSREAFGTTGTRIQPRLFGGWNFSADACRLENPAAHGYANGVPMGGDLDGNPSGGPTGAGPMFLASALQDPDAAQLQKLQLIKGWIDGEGQSRYKVFDIAGTENESGYVDLNTGAWSGSGSESLCAVFEDPEFDPGQAAYYYLRAVEVPTLRWSWAQCVALPESERPAECNNTAPKTQRELAWTSPIWYLPPH